jgi:ABC-type branched-subunit amino acid transport system ATPase component
VLSDIRFTLGRGQSVAVIGENGAGKSTFAKILAGVIRRDAGEIRFDGQPVAFDSPRAALQAGVACIPQELAYVPALTVGENILLGRWPSTAGLVSHRAVLRRGADEAGRYGIALDMNRTMARLRLADRQMVEIVKALARRARVLVLDEPTAALSDDESRNLFAVLKKLAAEGVGIVYISHRMDEVHRFSDRVDVFRKGETRRRRLCQEGGRRAHPRVTAPSDAPPWAFEPCPGCGRPLALATHELTCPCFDHRTRVAVAWICDDCDLIFGAVGLFTTWSDAISARQRELDDRASLHLSDASVYAPDP